ncbi:SURF1 family cytochrome oxidase biogenesis protein [Nocardioides abyssi]|uniref:SURF1-like protein n=1 Tax=Nocardioides abyssi TaxID=3058370 RepID=A0ABT8EVK0_9ACTN|nr:SURF1 family protein [Nocardioides abyssi]MDN4162124.1 SURF1 family protein [Nocardioides abyssi]
MRRFRFLLSRRWALFAVAIVVVAWATWWLGNWQFDRLDERRDSNRVVERNENLEPAPVGDILSPGGEVADEDEWRVVTATGEYAVEDTVIVRYRTRDGQSGIDVVVPLVTDDGTTLVVDRGWMATDNRGGDDADVPAPPPGEVTITGYVREDGTGDSTRVVDGRTRAVDSQAIGEAIGRETYGGFVDLRSEDPEPAESLAAPELPEQNDGPHFFYGLQWWFFGALAIFGFLYLAYDELKRGPHGQRSGKRPPRPKADPRTGKRPPRPPRQPADGDGAQSARNAPPSTGSITPETNDAAGDSRNAAARPNSSGRP